VCADNTERYGRYALVTPARNEQAYIANTILSVITQSVKPVRWVIVSDGSTDATDSIVEKYAADNAFIRLLKRDGDPRRNFGSQVRAIQAGSRLLEGVRYDFFGNLDADISFGPDYYEQILAKFRENPKLGLAGGFVHEKMKDEFRSRKFNSRNSVPHAVQFFRRKCYEDVGGYIPLKYGGPDWHAEVTARMNGWEVRSFPEIKVFHHRRTLGADGVLSGGYRQGMMDYSLGSSALFEILKCMTRVAHRPYFIYAACRLAGFAAACLKREQRIVSREFVSFLQNEQRARLAGIFKGEKEARGLRT